MFYFPILGIIIPIDYCFLPEGLKAPTSFLYSNGLYDDDVSNCLVFLFELLNTLELQCKWFINANGHWFSGL